MLTQEARELAFHYLSACGEKYTPEDYLCKVTEMEAIFLKMLQLRGRIMKSPIDR